MRNWIVHYCKALINVVLHPVEETAWLLAKYSRVCPNKIVFCSFGGKSYGCNPKYISEEILRQDLPWRIVWILNERGNDSLPKNVKVVPCSSKKAGIEVGTAKVVVSNIRGWQLLPKKKGQVFLQTWHGGMGFKHVEKAAEDKLSIDYKTIAQKDGRECDAIISNCAFLSDVYRKYFWLNKNTEILEYGLPRNDALFDRNRIERVYAEFRKKYSLDLNQRIILYLPTFREKGETAGYMLDYDGVIRCMEERLGQPVAIVARFHPNVADLKNYIPCDSRIINATEYPDVQELYMAADYLISDYSSAVFDFALLRKPVFLCLLDYEKYLQERGLNEIFYSCPFIHAYSNEELINLIANFDEKSYLKKHDAFFEKNALFDDGHASERTVDWIKRKMQV